METLGKPEILDPRSYQVPNGEHQVLSPKPHSKPDL